MQGYGNSKHNDRCELWRVRSELFVLHGHVTHKRFPPKTPSIPLILIYDISGSTFPYAVLGMEPTLKDYSIYAISATVPPDPSEKHHSIRAWASSYASIIAHELSGELQASSGKLILGDYSLGGILAAEVARIFSKPLDHGDPTKPRLSLRVCGLILLDTCAIWHPMLMSVEASITGKGADIARVLQDSAYYTSEQKDHIHTLLVRSGRQDWPGLSNTGFDRNTWLITPNSEGANGLEEWFEDNHGSLVRIGQNGEGCDHFSMMQLQWIGEVATHVGKAMRAAVSEV